MNNKYIIYLP